MSSIIGLSFVKSNMRSNMFVLQLYNMQPYPLAPLFMVRGTHSMTVSLDPE